MRAARERSPKWAAMTAYNRGQVLYRVAEMMEARRAEFAEFCCGPKEVERAIDRVVWYAGWADKLAQVLGSSNPGRRARTSTSPSRSRPASSGSSRRDEPALRGLVSRVAPAIIGGNAVVRVASETRPLAAIELAEVLATADVPGGVVNILTGRRGELAPVARVAHGRQRARPHRRRRRRSPDLERAAAENVKRVVHGAPTPRARGRSPRFLELKTVWHPIGV